MPPPDEIHRGVEIVVNTDINGRVLKKTVISIWNIYYAQ